MTAITGTSAIPSASWHHRRHSALGQPAALGARSAGGTRRRALAGSSGTADTRGRLGHDGLATMFKWPVPTIEEYSDGKMSGTLLASEASPYASRTRCINRRLSTKFTAAGELLQFPALRYHLATQSGNIPLHSSRRSARCSSRYSLSGQLSAHSGSSSPAPVTGTSLNHRQPRCRSSSGPDRRRADTAPADRPTGPQPAASSRSRPHWPPGYSRQRLRADSDGAPRARDDSIRVRLQTNGLAESPRRLPAVEAASLGGRQ